MDQANGIDQARFERESNEGIRQWISENLKGEVTEITRLERWRPQWRVDFKTAEGPATVLFRGNRPNASERNLRFEMEVMQVLEKNGINVPRIYGWVETPKAFVMAWIETEDREPGMIHTAIEKPAVLTDHRWQALLNYMTDLAAMHAIPLSEFAHIEELNNPPSSASQLALAAAERMYQAGRYTNNLDTTFEFLQSWLRRNVPAHRTKASFIAGDAGQFMSAGSEVLALVDFEIADLGDIHWDLACFRGRHPLEHMGDIPALYRRYEEVSGTAVDLHVVGYHTVAFLQFAGIATKFFGDPKAIGGNWIEGLLEYASITRRACEAIAELEDIALDHEMKLPEADKTPLEESALEKLIVDIQRLPTSKTFEVWERDLLKAIPAFLLNYSRYRNWYEDVTRADIEALVGREFETLKQAEIALGAVIAENDPTLDAGLVQVTHRRSLRLSMIISGTDPDPNNPLFHILEPILNTENHEK